MDDKHKNEADPSHDLDLVTVFHAAGTFSDMQAMQVQNLLEANGLEAFLIGDPRWPNLDDEVRVAREDAARAEELIKEALAAGPQAAAEGEAETEK